MASIETKPTCKDFALCRHLAAAEGQLAAATWLLDNDCSPNPVDRFQRTPLEVTSPRASPKQMQAMHLCAAINAATGLTLGGMYHASAKETAKRFSG